MNKRKCIVAGLLCLAIVFSIAGCSSKTLDNAHESSTISVNTDNESSNLPTNASSDSSPENDTDVGLKVIKIDSQDSNLTEDQKAVVEYFDTDYLEIYNYEAMRRYPQIFDGTQINVTGIVLKVISMDAEKYQLVLWLDVGSLDADMTSWLPNEYQGAYLLLSGKTGEEWFMEGDILDVYGRSNGVETISMDGTSYTMPRIDVQRAYQAQCDVRDGLITLYTSEKFDLSFIKHLAEIIFGENIEIRKPVIGEDIPEETAFLAQNAGFDLTEDRFVVELENQSNAKFTRFLFTKQGGVIQDIKDAMADFESGYERYIEFTKDFQHFFLFTYDHELNILTTEYYDTDFNKVWEREFMETTSAQYDYTKNNIYLTANNHLYIINTETGEDSYPPAYVGSKVAIRKLSDGILMISNNRSDGVMMTNLDGSIQWTTNLENDVASVNGLQVVDNRIVFNYQWLDENSVYQETYISINREDGSTLVSATPAY